MRKFLAANAFIVWILGLVLLAWALPEWGGPDSIIPVGLVRQIGVFLIFFIQGVQLPGEALKQGVLEWRLHVLVQGFTFGVFPLLVGALLWLTPILADQPDLRTGLLYLAFLPTTVTSAVALTSVAGGNVTGALFNCALSSVVGVFLVPFYIVSFLGIGGEEAGLPLGGLLGSIAGTILFPMVLGQVVRPWLKEPFTRHKVLFRRFNHGVILFIVWGAFCQSFLRDVWSQVSGGELFITITLVGALLGLVHLLVWVAAGGIGVPPESRITALYCGSQKTLAMGLPMSVLLFGSVEGVELSLILLPLLVYHPLQLILGGVLSPRLHPEI